MEKKTILRQVEPEMILYFSVLALFCAAGFYFSLWLGIVETVLSLVMLVLYYLFYSRHRRNLLRYMESALLSSDALSSKSMLTFPLPMTVIRTETGEIIWCNNSFKQLSGAQDQFFNVRLSTLIPGFELRWLEEGNSVCPYDVNYADRIFTIFGAVFSEGQPGGRDDDDMVILYWQDKTELLALERRVEDKNVLCAEIVFDNYDEAMNNLSDSRKSEVQAALEKELYLWASPAKGILRKVDRDRYLFVFEEKYYKRFAEEKFSIKKQLEKNPVTAEAAATLSIGIGREGESLKDNMTNARLALDMALSRGGDQVVVRSRLSFDFFGGGSEYEKRTKVKARIMANVLGGLIKDCSSLFIMGHSYADNDSLGAAIGLACAGRKSDKKTYIVINRESNNTAPMLAMLEHTGEYAGILLSPEDAMVESNANSLLIVVDTNRPEYVESPAVLESFNRVAVIDHHRRAADYIENAAVNIHEPSASSACEIVVELLQYLVNPNDIRKTEAIAMLAGITLDTKNFTLKTGVRTFDAASFLRRIGADTVEVKHLFQNDFDNFLKRGDLIRHTVFYEKMFAIARSPEPVETVVAAQAADELLSVVGVRASFVLFPSDNRVHISARSLGEINVQLIVERLGGGGHLTAAGCQLSGIPLEKAYSMLTEAIDNYVAQS